MEEKSILLRRAVISARGRRKPFFRGLRACPFHLNLPSVSSIASLLTGERGQRPRRRPCLILRPNTGLLWSKFPPSFSLLFLERHQRGLHQPTDRVNIGFFPARMA